MNSNKSNSMHKCNSAIKSKQNFSNNFGKQQSDFIKKQQTSPTANKFVLYEDQKLKFEVLMETKRTPPPHHKSPGPRAGGESISQQKSTNPNRRVNGCGDSLSSWSKILEGNNKNVVRQGLQASKFQMKMPRGASTALDFKECKTPDDATKRQKYNCTHSHKNLDEIPVKQSSKRHVEQSGGSNYKPLRKPAETLAASTTVPSSTSLTSSDSHVLVTDHGVQCGGLFDSSNDRPSFCNPIKTLAYWMRELECRITDDEAAKILSQMEQTLLRIPTTSDDLESIALRVKLEEAMLNAEKMTAEVNRKIKALSKDKESLIEEKRSLVLLVEKLRDEIREKNEKIANLYADNKKILLLQNELQEHSDAIHRHLMEISYLQLENDKLLTLSTFKDKQIAKLQNDLTEVPKIFAELMSVPLKSVRSDPALNTSETSVVQGGKACSSPTTSSSERSKVPPSWKDVSAIYMSDNNQLNARFHETTIDSRSDKQDVNSQKDYLIADSDRHENFSDKSIDKSKQRHSNMEFISLPAEETCFPPIQSQRLNGEKDSSSCGSDNDEAMSRGNEKNDCQSFERDLERAFIRSLDEKNSNLMNNRHNRTPKPLDPSAKSMKKRSSSKDNRKKFVNRESNSRDMRSNSSTDAINENLKQQFQTIFQTIKVDHKFPGNLPRCYSTELSDSSLTSVSLKSEHRNHV